MNFTDAAPLEADLPLYEALERTVFVHALAKMQGGNARETTLRRCCPLPLPRGVKEPVDVSLVVVDVT